MCQFLPCLIFITQFCKQGRGNGERGIHSPAPATLEQHGLFGTARSLTLHGPVQNDQPLLYRSVSLHVIQVRHFVLYHYHYVPLAALRI
jgi:hypothetical protein